MTAKKTAAVDPLVQRDELLDRLARVLERGDAHSLRQRELKQALDAAESSLAEARIGEVTGAATPSDVQRAIDAREGVSTDMKPLDAELYAIEAARKRTERLLIQLHVRHRPAFEAEAERASKAADEALAQLAPTLRSAAEAWGEAQAAWSRATAWIDHVSLPSLDREHQLGRVPDFPMKLTLGATQPRPYERRVEGAEAELIPDRIVVFSDARRNGAELKVALGSANWRDMLASPRFTCLRYEKPASS